ncbi:MAG: sulfur carrier protein ThiS, partial [Kiritimatiellaeota bacterium]|nr:sulfur carrier protein ThiS [Kiritimatiellota bacterium]
MKVHVNGEAMERPAGETLAVLLAALGAGNGRVATLVNDDVVPAATHAMQKLAEGDR